MNKEDIEKIREKIKNIPRNCRYCINLYQWWLDYESGYYEPSYCQERESVWNLNSFPFKKEQKCFELDYEFIDFEDTELIDLRNGQEYDKRNKLRNKRYWDLIK